MSIYRKYKFKIKCTCGKIDRMARSDNNLSNLKCSRCHKVGTTKYIKVKKRRSIHDIRYR